MKIMRIASAFALLSVLSATSQAAEPLRPTGKWTVDFGDAHCIAMRSFGPPAKPVTLALKPSPIGDVMQLSVVRASGSNEVNQTDGTLILDQLPPVKVSVLGYAPKANKVRVSAINLPLSVYEPIRRASSLRLRSSGELEEAFALSQMEPVARALDQCVVGLRERWHIASSESEISQPAKSTKALHSYFSTSDYPRVALRGEASGTVALVMLIDESGKIASCMATATSGYASLDTQSCFVLTNRMRFTPALGKDGKPTRSGMTARIKWKMP